jgi:hypothetical protein
MEASRTMRASMHVSMIARTASNRRGSPSIVLTVWLKARSVNYNKEGEEGHAVVLGSELRTSGVRDG